MSFNYANSAATARRLLKRFGRIAQVQTVTEGTYDPATSTDTPSTITNTDVQCADFDFDDKSGGQMYQSDSLVQVGDRYVLLSADKANIDTSDKLIIDGVTWNVINVKRLAPANVTVLYTAHIRK